MPSEALQRPQGQAGSSRRWLSDPGCRHFDPRCRNGSFTDISVSMVRSARQPARGQTPWTTEGTACTRWHHGMCPGTGTCRGSHRATECARRPFITLDSNVCQRSKNGSGAAFYDPADFSENDDQSFSHTLSGRAKPLLGAFGTGQGRKQPIWCSGRVPNRRLFSESVPVMAPARERSKAHTMTAVLKELPDSVLDRAE